MRQGTGQRAWLAGWLAAVPFGFAQPAGDVPWARITSPAESRIEAPGVTQVKARADLGGQAIEQIVFAIDGETVFADTAEPYVYEWQNRRVGKFVFTVIAQGINGEAVESLRNTRFANARVAEIRECFAQVHDSFKMLDERARQVARPFGVETRELGELLELSTRRSAKGKEGLSSHPQA